MIKNIQILNVPVTDQDAAHRFYVETLGLEVVADQEMDPHGRWLQVAPKNAETSIALTASNELAGSVAGLVFETGDIEAAVGRLRQRHVDFPHGIEDMPWGRAARFSDPDGNQLVLQTPPRSAG